MKAETVPVKVARATYTRLKTYSAVTGIPIGRIVTKALTEWMDVVGDLHLETIAKTKLQVVMPEADVPDIPAETAHS